MPATAIASSPRSAPTSPPPAAPSAASSSSRSTSRFASSVVVSPFFPGGFPEGFFPAMLNPSSSPGRGGADAVLHRSPRALQVVSCCPELTQVRVVTALLYFCFMGQSDWEVEWRSSGKPGLIFFFNRQESYFAYLFGVREPGFYGAIVSFSCSSCCCSVD